MSRHWSANAIVEARVPNVFAALLAVGPTSDAHSDPTADSPGVDSDGLRRYRPTGGDPATTVTVEVDPGRHTLVVQGNWWYRGVYTVIERPHGCLIEYRVYNVATRAQWAVPVMQYRLPGRMRRDLDALAQAIGRYLNCRAYLDPGNDRAPH
jgi:hypothetical protein